MPTRQVLRRMNPRHQITIPPYILREAGVPEDGLFLIEARPGRVVLESKVVADGELDEKEWEKLDTLVKRQVRLKEYTEYPSLQKAKKHLR